MKSRISEEKAYEIWKTRWNPLRPGRKRYRCHLGADAVGARHEQGVVAVAGRLQVEEAAETADAADAAGPPRPVDLGADLVDEAGPPLRGPAAAAPGPAAAPDASVGSLDLEHFDKEKGLLDASGASLIDGLLDFSLL